MDRKLLILILVFALAVSSASTYYYFRKEKTTPVPSWTPPNEKFTLYLGQIMGDPPTAFTHKDPKSTWILKIADISVVVNGVAITFEAPVGQWIILWGVPYMVVSVSDQSVELDPYESFPMRLKIG